MIRRRVTVLGSTGSVGCSTLELMDQAEREGTGAFEVEVLTGGRNIARLAEQARRWRPRIAVTADAGRLDELRDALAGTGVEAAAGEDAIALVGVDQDPGDALVEKIRALPHVKEARTLRF